MLFGCAAFPQWRPRGLCCQIPQCRTAPGHPSQSVVVCRPIVLKRFHSLHLQPHSHIIRLCCKATHKLSVLILVLLYFTSLHAKNQHQYGSHILLYQEEIRSKILMNRTKDAQMRSHPLFLKNTMSVLLSCAQIQPRFIGSTERCCFSLFIACYLRGIASHNADYVVFSIPQVPNARSCGGVRCR